MQLDLSSFSSAIARQLGAHPCVTKGKMTTGKSLRRRQSVSYMGLLWTTAEQQRADPDIQQIRIGK